MHGPDCLHLLEEKKNHKVITMTDLDFLIKLPAYVSTVDTLVINYRSARSCSQEQAVCNYPTGFVQQLQQYHCESGFLDAVHVRPGVGHHDVRLRLVANGAVHQRLVGPEVGAEGESWRRSSFTKSEN